MGKNKRNQPSENRILDILVHLPNVKEEYRKEEWFTAPNYYPIYNKLGKILKPKSILEIGTLQGYSLISLLDGSCNVSEVTWVDNESYIPNSNAMCFENLQYYLDHFGKQGRKLDVEFSRSKKILLNQIIEGKKYDLIHIDGDHSYAGKLEDLHIALQLQPKFILLDDFNYLEEVQKAVKDWSLYTGFPFVVIPTYRGMAFFDLTDDKRAYSLLQSNKIPFTEMSASNNNSTLRCWCGGTVRPSQHPQYFQCENCGTLISKANQEKQMFEEFYTFDGYWHQYVESFGYPNVEQRGEVLLRDRIPNWFQLLKRYKSSINSVLEIGCAEGSFLGYCRQNGIPITVGVEVDPQTCEFAKQHYNLEYVCSGLYPQVELPFEKFDIIAAFDVLEHFSNPLSALKSMKNNLNEDGICIFQTPCYNNEGGNWIHFKPQEHLYLFNEENIRLLLDRCGFDVIAIERGALMEDMAIVARKKVNVDLLTPQIVSQRTASSFHKLAKKTIGIGLIEHFGDIVACEPVARYVRAMNPDATIVWCVREPYKELVQYNPYLDDVFIVDCLTEWIALVEDEVFDEVVDLHVDERICLVCALPLKKRSSFRVTGENYYHLGNLLSAFSKGAALPALTATPKIYMPVEVRKNVDALNLPSNFVVIHGKSNEVERDWNAAGWAKVVHHVKTKYNLPIIEIGLEPCISAFIKDSINLCGKMSLLEMAEIINRAVMFIGIDSGPAHLANAVGTKGVVLLGRYRNFQRYFPYSGWYEDAENCYCVCNQYGPASNILPSSVLDAIDSMMAKSNYKTHQPCYIDERQNQHNVELLYPFNSDRILEDITTNLYQSKSENHFEEVDYYARHALRVLAKMEAQYLHISKLQKKSIGTITELRDFDIDIARFIIERSIVQYKKSEFAKACSFLKIALLRLLGFAEKSAVDVTKIFDFKELERIVSEMIEKGAGNDGYKVLALAKILQSSFESALVILRGILKQNPNDQDAQKMLNLLLAMVDNFQNSVEQTNGGHTAQGKFTNELQYAEEHIQNGHYDDAEKLLCHLLSIDAKNVDALNDLAIVHQLKGNTSEAIQLLHKVLAIDERNEIALENLLFLSGKLNNIRQIQR